MRPHLLLALLLIGCQPTEPASAPEPAPTPATPPDAGAGGATGTTGSGGSAGGVSGFGGAGGAGGAGGSGSSSWTTTGGDGGLPAGTLTAGTWDDNLNFATFTQYEGQLHARAIADATRRLRIHVHDAAGLPVAGATVRLDTAGAPASTITGTDGVALFFPSWDGDAPSITVDTGGAVVSQPVPAGATELSVEAGAAAAATSLDLAVVLDTTGSMGDEAQWLRAEVDAIAAAVSARYPGVTQRWALVLYRDRGDAYVTRTFDFDTLANFRAQLAAVTADGGGDLPEAVDEAMLAASQLSWRSTARLAFHLADAAQHDDRGAQVAAALKELRARGVHYYPVAASGAGALFELTFRIAALTTGGRYLFLTDDSGVGDAHAAPTIPCYFVTTLVSAMVRMIDIEVSGVPHEPAPAEILRSSGDLQACDAF